MSIQIKEIIRRFLLGSLMGAFIGGLELWFYKFNLRHGIAAILSGALFGSLLGLLGPSMLRGVKGALIFSAGAGGLAGVVWWVVASPTVTIFLSIAVGVALGTLFVWSEGNWKSKKQDSVQQGAQPDRE
jgi:hypothetical protein